MQKNKTEDKDDTNVIWERKKKKFLKKQEITGVLCPYLDNDQRSDKEYKEFANLFLAKFGICKISMRLNVNASVKNALLPF